MSDAIIEADGLTREFRVRDGRRRRLLTAVDGLTVSIEPGAAVGYIGANGAGKSTTIKMLTGILVPTAGSVLTCGLRPVPDRRRLARQVGVVFGFFFPLAFTAYLPAVTMLGLPGSQWLPAWLGWCAPAAAVWSWLMGLLCWRWGVRHYQGGGG